MPAEGSGPMVKVQIWGSLKDAFDGESEIEVEAKNLRQLVEALEQRFPGIGEEFADQISVAIDGKLYNDNWFQPIAPESEVVVLPRISGG